MGCVCEDISREFHAHVGNAVGAVQDFDNTYPRPIADAMIDGVKQGGAGVQQAVDGAVNAVSQGAKNFDNQVQQAGRDIHGAVQGAVDGAVNDIANARIPQITPPSIDVPNITPPNINVPNIGDFVGGPSHAAPTPGSGNAFTDAVGSRGFNAPVPGGGFDNIRNAVQDGLGL